MSSPLTADPRSDAQRADLVRALAAERRVPALVGMLSERSWSVRREVVAALAALGEDAELPLLACLRTQRDDEARIAATVDALADSTSTRVD
ncbi:MAG TPA: HEAT repeat domain-containing protein, partial [Polyangiales bacterium]